VTPLPELPRRRDDQCASFEECDECARKYGRFFPFGTATEKVNQKGN
jgi:hypothetical protein